MLFELLMIPVVLYGIVAALYVLRFVFILVPEWLLDQRPSVKRKRAACERIMRIYTRNTYVNEIPADTWTTVPLAQLVDSKYFDKDGYFRN